MDADLVLHRNNLVAPENQIGIGQIKGLVLHRNVPLGIADQVCTCTPSRGLGYVSDSRRVNAMTERKFDELTDDEVVNLKLNGLLQKTVEHSLMIQKLTAAFGGVTMAFLTLAGVMVVRMLV